MLDDAGVIGNGADWLPETAFVKLCWVLGHEKKLAKVKEMMMTNIAGEISERSAIL
jgi:glutamyl-tRNA(Gln) amidotransferase subunit D